MNLPLLFDAPFEIRLHVVTALLAVLFAPAALLRQSRDGLHRLLGYGFVLSMVAAALSSFLIRSMPVIGPFSPIHVLSVFALVSVVRGVGFARKGDIARHRAEMTGLALYALGLPAVLTLMPGRRMSQALFPEAPVAGFAGALVVFALLWLWARRRAEKPGQAQSMGGQKA